MLLACAQAPRYGYELGAWLETEGLSAGPVSPGRLYETLAALARAQALAVTDEPGARGPARRRYQLTEDGRLRLRRWVESLQGSAELLGRLLARAAAEADRPGPGPQGDPASGGGSG